MQGEMVNAIAFLTARTAVHGVSVLDAGGRYCLYRLVLVIIGNLADNSTSYTTRQGLTSGITRNISPSVAVRIGSYSHTAVAALLTREAVLTADLPLDGNIAP